MHIVQRFAAESAKVIVAGLADKPYRMAQPRYTARKDSRGTAQHHSHLSGQHLAAQHRRGCQAREHNIDVQFTNHQDSG